MGLELEQRDVAELDQVEDTAGLLAEFVAVAAVRRVLDSDDRVARVVEELVVALRTVLLRAREPCWKIAIGTGPVSASFGSVIVKGTGSVSRRGRPEPSRVSSLASGVVQIVRERERTAHDETAVRRARDARHGEAGRRRGERVLLDRDHVGGVAPVRARGHAQHERDVVARDGNRRHRLEEVEQRPDHFVGIYVSSRSFEAVGSSSARSKNADAPIGRARRRGEEAIRHDHRVAAAGPQHDRREEDQRVVHRCRRAPGRLGPRPRRECARRSRGSRDRRRRARSARTDAARRELVRGKQRAVHRVRERQHDRPDRAPSVERRQRGGDAVDHEVAQVAEGRSAEGQTTPAGRRARVGLVHQSSGKGPNDLGAVAVVDRRGRRGVAGGATGKVRSVTPLASRHTTRQVPAGSSTTGSSTTLRSSTA